MNIIKQLIKGYENSFGSAFISIIFVFVALVPSVSLFYFLNSSASVDLTGTDYVRGTVRFGGPPALFAVLYWYMLDTHKKVSRVAEILSVRGTVYLDGSAKEGVTVYAEGDNRAVTTSYTGSFELKLNSSQSSWIIVAQYQKLSVKKSIESNQLSVPHRLELQTILGQADTKLSVRGTVYLDGSAKEGVTVYAEGDNRAVTTSYKSNQLSVPLHLELHSGSGSDEKRREEITIFDSNVQRKPVNLGCNPSQAQHGVKLTKNLISWQWEKRFSCWCGWMFQGLGIQNFDEDIRANCNLEIVYSSTYIGNPSPQVKFLDSDGNNSQLKDFSAYEQQDTARQKHIVTISVSEFNLELSTDSTKIEKLQFDTGWDSTLTPLHIK